MPQTHQLITMQQLDAVRQPIHTAKGMPNGAYIDNQLFQFERDSILANTWVALAYSSDIPAKGFIKPVDFMGLPLAIFRHREGHYNVFHNVCSHRGMQLVTEEIQVKSMVTCPYHSWSYDLNGNLKGTANIGGVGIHKIDGFSCAEHGLKKIRSQEWMGMIFINLSGQAPSFDDFIAPLVDRWSQFCGAEGWHDLHIAPTGSQLQLEVKCNYKLAIENYCEAYHLPWVHPGLNTYSPLEKHYNLIVSDYMSGQGSLCYNLADVAGTRLPRFDQWPADKLHQAEYVSLYPNVLLGIQADHFFTIILEPLAPDLTRESLRLFYVTDRALGDEFSACRQAQLDAWKIVFQEDVFAVEGMQAGRASPGYAGGVFSPVLDVPTHHFHTWVANRYAQALDKESAHD